MMQCFGQVNQCKSACSGGWLSSRVQSTDHGWVHLADLQFLKWISVIRGCMMMHVWKKREIPTRSTIWHRPSHLQSAIHSIIHRAKYQDLMNLMYRNVSLHPHQYPNRVICLRPSGQWQQVQLALWESSRTPPWCSCSELSLNETTSKPNFESIWI